MEREEVLLAESIQRTLDETHRAHVKFHDAQECSTPESIDDHDNHELDDANDELAYLIDKVYRDTAILAERLRLPQFAAQINAERSAASTGFTKNTYTHTTCFRTFHTWRALEPTTRHFVR
jgi:hypothetical protein